MKIICFLLFPTPHNIKSCGRISRQVHLILAQNHTCRQCSTEFETVTEHSAENQSGSEILQSISHQVPFCTIQNVYKCRFICLKHLQILFQKSYFQYRMNKSLNVYSKSYIIEGHNKNPVYSDQYMEVTILWLLLRPE